MIGRTISHYRVIEKLGAGGMGVVYKAEDTKLGRLVALKVLSDALLSDPSALERFQREARAASALNHPNICTIHEVDAVDGRPFLVMELLEGQTDLFSLGAVLYELATGTRAFAGSTTAMIFDAILHKQPVPPTQIRHDLNPALEPIIMKALEKNRDLRYQSAADIRADLERLKNDSGATAPARPRKRVAWAMVAAAVLVAIAELLLWRRPSGGTTSSKQSTVAESRASTLA